MKLTPFKMTALVNAYAVLRIPLLAFVTPVIEEIGGKRTSVRVRLGLRTRNHLGVMYFGALSMGAELSIAARAVQEIAEGRKKIDFIFKDFQCDFLKRVDGHVRFLCDEADEVAEFIAEVERRGERVTKTFSGYAIVPSKSQEPVMTYKLTLSAKPRA